MFFDELILILLSINFRFSQIGVVSQGLDCPSKGIYARVTEVKNWIQFVAAGALDSNCNDEAPFLPGRTSILLNVLKILALLLGVLVTGSLGQGETSAEVWLADGRSCSLPDLPQARYAHTQSGMTGCGGFGFDSLISSTCITFNGEWEQSHVLTVPRQFHVSWRSSSGILLLGGMEVAGPFVTDLGVETTTELLSTMESTSTSHFDLPYVTRF